MILRQAQDRRGMAGATLLEIMVAMLVIGLVATGILTAFVFSRRVTWRSGTELSGSGLVAETAEALRGAVGGNLPNGLSLQPGIYVDENMGAPRPATSTQISGLNFPANFLRFQSANATGPNLGDTDNDGNPDHGDGRVVVVERSDENGNGIADEDLDGDGQIGLDLDGVLTTTELYRVRVRVKWTSPTT